MEDKFLITTSKIPIFEINFNLNDLRSRCSNFVVSKISNPDDDLVYVFDYLSGKNTENPVYLPDGEHLVNSEIVQEEDKDSSHKNLLERFNQLVLDVGVE